MSHAAHDDHSETDSIFDGTDSSTHPVGGSDEAGATDADTDSTSPENTDADIDSVGNSDTDGDSNDETDSDIPSSDEPDTAEETGDSSETDPPLQEGYFVSPSGDDNNPGTIPDAPWASLDAHAKVAPGGIVHFERGGV